MECYEDESRDSDMGHVVKTGTCGWMLLNVECSETFRRALHDGDDDDVTASTTTSCSSSSSEPVTTDDQLRQDDEDDQDDRDAKDIDVKNVFSFFLF